ncbi:haloacid dehalogenase superfamily, subfamily IA, variant 3 with third motif having DD or ED/haloacid dehalogenase superfamily, subfamily IA, variant 1 with third motif having Dx(3-4)D or Dx(3-4)E [Sulfobacillus thermosulfidooxidans DSM 9293]|uniref:Haloacid dehalogenase superfamily, subfamily IA, variant 3 with third motif having DD or ED/haloacid dehalogenase superfamily, subfamily IA, variant 1 with third motif having Dx(3-4)D or Dx(3-4)E n=1 Tax=Sulfobacillus thermosulfidooxidans (strain DSM 9293 / VKM B-1269 / AT-1) TaxID=929705 RepID=A0A1W1WNY1_SULTA|nr:HAD family hydrolase [Sulfobacillus thermosulfidooxidans]SMC07909.1 haloacid dehalogenase superfamily, subfamily IA, variant 3 with third motif having DD or ED/haloacid dehalogenase superfamily, subfamily IA, variant 1 with third motif having Dx(3-4)D or Dx(3-4)E [Sulfobacillus thermosulfidooxidans DSM 9293]
MFLYGIIFDIGNVLIHPDGNRISQILFDTTGKHVPAPLCRKAFSFADHEIFQPNDPLRLRQDEPYAVVWGKHIGLDKSDSLRVWEHMERESESVWGELDGYAIPLLQYLRLENIKVGALSNGTGDTEATLIKYGLRDFFDVVVDSAVVGIEKPDFRVYREALRLLDVDAQQCCYVGDSPEEVWAPQQLGFGVSILVDPMDVYQDCPLFDLRVSSLLEVRQIIGFRPHSIFRGTYDY